MNSKAIKTLEYNKIITKLVSFAQSALGKQRCEELMPSSDIEEISLNQAKTAAALNIVYKKGSISLNAIKEIRPSLQRLDVGSSLGLIELLNISSVLDVTNRAKQYSRKPEGADIDILDSYFNELQPLTEINNELKRCIISEEEISDDATPGLSHVRRAIKNSHSQLQSQLNSILNSSTTRTMLQDAVITMRNGRYCLPIKSEYKSQFQGMLHDQSSSGATLFIEPMAIVKINNEIRELEIKEHAEIEKLLATLSEMVGSQSEALLTNINILIELDFIFAKASFAKSLNASEPIFNNRKYINIKKGRHPLLDQKTVVPIDITLGDKFNMLIITGPNTGGKTVSLKTVGLFTLMGQAGLHIPAFDGSELSVFEDVFADIGDEQSIEQSLSTFSSHMTNIVSILDKANYNTLVLFDELGAGTDPVEGAALAMAILQQLHKSQVRVMATTHYSELKIYAISTDGVENACCEFDVASLRPTYKLLVGIPGKSNAFAISSRLGLPRYIIDEAEKIVPQNEKDFETVISEIESKRKDIEKDKLLIEEYKKEVATLKNELEVEHTKLDEKKEKILRIANEKAQEILEDAKELADESIRKITKMQGPNMKHSDLEKERQRIKEQLDKVESNLSFKKKVQKPKKALASVKLGDSVKVHSLGLNGIVTSLPNAKGDLYVQMGILKSLVNMRDLELLMDPITTPDKPSNTGAGKIGMSKTSSISPEINLLGLTVDDAIVKLDKYLDDAHLSRLTKVSVVHGKGTGALRNGVHQFLKRVPYVKSFRLGVFGEGDTGVTIVEFK
ncbi:MAG: MutS2 family protein [Clostridiales bacterium]|nr:MutS2 family protein [Clostridiales bacterium]